MTDIEILDPLAQSFENDTLELPTHTTINSILCKEGICRLIDGTSDVAVFKTPYYRTLNMCVCSEEPDIRYTSYNLFCLKTRLQPFVNTMFGDDVQIRLLSSIEKEKILVLNVVLLREHKVEMTNRYELNINLGIEVLTITPEQKLRMDNKITEITSLYSDACLLFPKNTKVYTKDTMVQISYTWLNEILPYIHLADKYRSFCDDNGYHIVLTKYLLPPTKAEKSNETSTYYTKYSKKYQEVYEALQNMYSQGYIILTSPNVNFLSAWGLVEVDNQFKVFKSTWFDKRICTDLVKFFRDRLSGYNTIFIPCKSNLVQKHQIALALQELNFSFFLDTVQVQANSIKELNTICNSLFDAHASASGTVEIDTSKPCYRCSDSHKTGDYVEYTKLDTVPSIIYSKRINM